MYPTILDIHKPDVRWLVARWWRINGGRCAQRSPGWGLLRCVMLWDMSRGVKGQLTVCICQMNPGAKKERLLQNGEREAEKTVMSSSAKNNIHFFGLVRPSVIPHDVISYNLQVFLIFSAFLQLTGVSKHTVAHIHTSEQLSSGHKHLRWSVQGPNASLRAEKKNLPTPFFFSLALDSPLPIIILHL